jgi:hypothetical protein
VNLQRENKKGRNGQFVKRKTKALGVGRNFPLENIKKGQQTKAEKKPNPVHLSVIDSLDATKIHFSARNLFIAHRVEERNNEEKVFAYDTRTRAERIHIFLEEAKGEWVLAEPNLRDYWEALSRSKVAQLPQIGDNIIEVMRANPAKSFEHTKCAQGSTRFCISHGRGRRCTFPGCDKGARDKFFCAAYVIQMGKWRELIPYHAVLTRCFLLCFFVSLVTEEASVALTQAAQIRSCRISHVH